MMTLKKIAAVEPRFTIKACVETEVCDFRMLKKF